MLTAEIGGHTTVQRVWKEHGPNPPSSAARDVQAIGQEGEEDMRLDGVTWERQESWNDVRRLAFGKQWDDKVSNSEADDVSAQGIPPTFS